LPHFNSDLKISFADFLTRAIMEQDVRILLSFKNARQDSPPPGKKNPRHQLRDAEKQICVPRSKRRGIQFAKNKTPALRI
jgi:hypothetical protein